MKKLFSFLSIVFALLAGFSACGNTKTDNYTDSEIAKSDSNDEDSGNTSDTGNTGNTEYFDDTIYGIEYCVFIKVSGTVTNEESLPLENIDVHFCEKYYAEEECDLVSVSDSGGEFEFTKENSTFDINDNLSLKFHDSSGRYSNKDVFIEMECIFDENDGRIYKYDCKNEDVKVVMEETSDDDTDSDI
ncbi:MAG TPA: hypothetical protein PLG63_04255 [bacterium]|jgi:hypothetical protein|nr:hypothetical protein [bacterium]HPM45564.1 hypothetical protein [bacterium]